MAARERGSDNVARALDKVLQNAAAVGRREIDIASDKLILFSDMHRDAGNAADEWGWAMDHRIGEAAAKPGVVRPKTRSLQTGGCPLAKAYCISPTIPLYFDYVYPTLR